MNKNNFFKLKYGRIHTIKKKKLSNNNPTLKFTCIKVVK